MKMTAEEIAKRYKEDPSRDNMQQLAKENGCSLQEVGQFLKDAAEKENKRKPGRPKKDPQSGKKPHGGALKIDTEKKLSIKSELDSAKMSAEKEPKKEIPEAVRRTLMNRLELLAEKQRGLIASLEAVNEEREEISRFLWG